MRPTVFVAVCGACVFSAPSQAQNDPQRVPVLASLTQCRSISDAAQRLACFDRAAADLDNAERRGDVFVADRAEIQKTKRSLFGLTLPTISLFKRRDGKDEPEQEIRQIESTVAAAEPSGRSYWTLRLADNSVWRTIEPSRFDPERGNTIRVRRAAMGSYLANIAGATAVRVERVR